MHAVARSRSFGIVGDGVQNCLLGPAGPDTACVAPNDALRDLGKERGRWDRLGSIQFGPFSGGDSVRNEGHQLVVRIDPRPALLPYIPCRILT